MWLLDDLQLKTELLLLNHPDLVVNGWSQKVLQLHTIAQSVTPWVPPSSFYKNLI
jgi:hypothetical protein